MTRRTFLGVSGAASSILVYRPRRRSAIARPATVAVRVGIGHPTFGGSGAGIYSDVYGDLY